MKLKNIKPIIIIENNNYYTIEQVADYYGVTQTAIGNLLNNHEKIFKKDGYKNYKPDKILKLLKSDINNYEINNFRTTINLNNNETIHIPTNGRKFLSDKCVFRMAFLISSSEIASDIRKQVLLEDVELYYELSNHKLPKLKTNEITIKNYLEFSFGKKNVEYQVKCGKYILDFVLYNVIHIEVDERGHINYDKNKEEIRSKYISEETNYWTIRYNPQKQKPYQLILGIMNALECIEYSEDLCNNYIANMDDLKLEYIDEFNYVKQFHFGKQPIISEERVLKLN